MEDIPNYVLYIILFILLIIVLLFVLKYKFNWSFKISIGRKDAEVIKSEVNNSNVTESKDNVTKIDEIGVPVVAQWKRIRLGTMRFVGSIPGLAQWVKDPALP